MVKVFPIGIGGAAYIRSLRGPLPNIALVPTGGVTLDNIGELFDAGAVAVGVGSELISRNAVAQRDYLTIGAMGRKFLAARHRTRRSE
jgi:2-dehydro-3-deoxyphosphogluconate aldolase / (4S)-4-hydroxy-2-oxoglutarate aldolase